MGKAMNVTQNISRQSTVSSALFQCKPLKTTGGATSALIFDVSRVTAVTVFDNQFSEILAPNNSNSNSIWHGPTLKVYTFGVDWKDVQYVRHTVYSWTPGFGGNVYRKPADALLHASEVDRWLSAHLADSIEPLSLTENTNHGDDIWQKTLLREKDADQGLYCSSAEDWARLSIEFLMNILLVDEASRAIASDTALGISAEPQHSGSLQGVFVHQLMFAVRYSNFEQLRVKHDLQNAASDLVAMLRDAPMAKARQKKSTRSQGTAAVLREPLGSAPARDRSGMNQWEEKKEGDPSTLGLT
ncbi:hypothetical protein B0H11DRAFT_1913873 [Mycena galericulata]|nr:hypothetical protein B0H11DRAFT_1913873 [Mycena galericulata]